MADVRTVGLKTVQVQPGDTLWTIAKRELGNGKYYLNVYLMNAVNLIKEGHEVQSNKVGPDYIYPGQLVHIVQGIEFDPSGFTPSGQ